MILARSKETPNKRGQSLNRHSTEHNNRAEQGILFATRYIWSSRSLRKRNTEDCFGILSRRWNNGILLLLSLHSCAFWLMSYVRDELMFTFPTLIRPKPLPQLSLSSIEAAPCLLVIDIASSEKCADGSTRARARGARALNSAHKRAVNTRRFVCWLE